MRILSTLPRALLTAAEIRSGRSLTAPLQLETDVVVVGSGAGGGMLARQTSQAGLRTVLLEEGGKHSPAEFNQREGDMLPGAASITSGGQTFELGPGQAALLEAADGTRSVADKNGMLLFEYPGDLRDLSSSLRTNAERLMRDVSAAHGRLVAGLDQAAPADTTPRRRPREAGPVDDVPEFLPGLD